MWPRFRLGLDHLFLVRLWSPQVLVPGPEEEDDDFYNSLSFQPINLILVLKMEDNFRICKLS